MLQLENKSPFAASLAALPDAAGVDTLFVIVKATLALRPKLSLAEKQVPVAAADVHWGDPATTSIKYASEVHLPKPTTDVVLVGSAWTTGVPQKNQVDVLFEAAGRAKVLRVFGNRLWLPSLLAPTMSAAQPFESMPIVYERAYGGLHRPDPKGEAFFAEERNPVGTGFRGKRGLGEMAGQLLPNIEDPRHPIQSAGAAGLPVGFGFIAAHWLPRRKFAGTYDEAWQKTRAPFLPRDFDPRFGNAAHPDLVLDRHLQGGEPVMAVNLSKHGPLKFNLPVCAFDVAVHVEGRTEKPPMKFETVLLEPDEDRICLTWRGAVPVDKKLLRVERATIALADFTIDGKRQ